MERMRRPSEEQYRTCIKCGHRKKIEEFEECEINRSRRCKTCRRKYWQERCKRNWKLQSGAARDRMLVAQDRAAEHDNPSISTVFWVDGSYIHGGRKCQEPLSFRGRRGNEGPGYDGCAELHFFCFACQESIFLPEIAFFQIRARPKARVIIAA